MKLELGPLLATVDRLGLTAALSFPPDLDLEVAFKPPTSIGLQVEASVLTGGGFLDIDPGPQTDQFLRGGLWHV
jgi:hypothetical protein